VYCVTVAGGKHSYRTTDFAKAFHIDCLIQLTEQYRFFILYLSHTHTLAYSEYTAETDINVLIQCCCVPKRYDKIVIYVHPPANPKAG